MKVNDILTEAKDIPEDVHAMLLKLRKDSYGFLNPKKLAQVLEVLPGWSMEKKVVYLPVDSTYSKEVEAIVDKDIYSRANDPRDPNTPITFYGRKDTMDKFNKLHDYFIQNEISEFPDNAKNRQVFIKNVSSIADDSEEMYGEVHKIFQVNLYSSSKPGFEIKGPNGQTFALGKPLRYNAYNVSEFIRWTKREGNTFMADILEVLGMEAPEVEKENKIRSVENTGQCPVCLRTQKLRRGVMVNHGYTRPGYGYIEGNCYGVGYKPYEKSAEGCEDYLNELKRVLKNTQNELNDLRTGKIKSITVDLGRRGRPDIQKLTPDHERFKEFSDKRARSLETQEKYLKADIEMYTKLIKDWKEVDFKWEKAQDQQ